MAVGDDVDAFHNFCFAIMAVFASLVSDVSIKLGEHRHQLVVSEYWTKTDDKLKDGWKGVHKATFQSVTLCMLIIIVSAIAIGIPSTNLDQRMTLILEGLGLIYAAVMLGFLSFNVAVWTGVYYKVWPHPEKEAPKTQRELQWKVRWSFIKIFGRYFFFLLPFYQGVKPWTIPISLLAGIALGLAVDWGVYLCRRREQRTRKIVSGIFTFIIVCCSSFMMGIGVYYIAYVWDTLENPRRDLIMLVVFFICLAVEGCMHIVRGWWSRKQFGSEDKTQDVTASEGASSNADPLATSARPRMAFSLITSGRNLIKQKDAWMKEEQSIEALGVVPEGDSEDEEDADEPQETTQEGMEENGDEDQQDVEAQNETSIAQDPPEVEEAVTAVGAAEISDEKDSQDAKGDDEEEDIAVPTYRQLCCAWKCCGCMRGDDRTTSEKVYAFFKWLVWFALVVFSLYLVIVNAGATVQQDDARAKLPYVEEVLYETMDEGPVCAFDNKGEDSNITTFPDKDAAHAEGFLVVHCGACGACSTFHNLRVNYETREYLASASAACAKKSLFGGAQAVTDCLEEPPIEFQGECAVCWTEDILCTKDFCAFIFLQSTMINTVSNFQVSKDTITSASCEEAHCEAANPGDFVYCSGATRRRMNVTSSIARPGLQRCGIVDVNWEEVFPS